MAIGDAVAIFLGTATANYQPASGVEVQISHIGGDGASDAMAAYDGTNTVNCGEGQSSNLDSTSRNMALMVTNALYLRKAGTTNRYIVAGVQTNA